MYTKVLAVVLLQTLALAVEDIPTSYSAFNNYHNTIKHIQSRHPHQPAPPHQYNILAKSSGYTGYSPPPRGLSSHASTHSAPSIQYAPSPVSSHGEEQYAEPSAAQYSAPLGTHQYSAPSGTHQYSAPQYTVQYAAPATHGEQYSAPLATQAIQYSAPAPRVSYNPQYSEDRQGGYYSGQHDGEYSHPKYQFSYGVEDHHTGDIHSHKETRNGDRTLGEYSLHEADGTIRTVKYTVDKHSGFNAVVEKHGRSSHSQPQTQHGKNAYY